jgi:hypothetical protein
VWAVPRVQSIAEEFEETSGQRLNREQIENIANAGADNGGDTYNWSDCRVVASAKLLGLIIGFNLSEDDIGSEAEARYYERLRILEAIPASWATKVITLSVFMRSLFGYIGRHALLPQRLRQRIERTDSEYIAKVPYVAVSFLSHLKEIYGISVNLVDFQLASMAALIATALNIEKCGPGAARILHKPAQETQIPSHRLRPSYTYSLQLLGSTIHWWAVLSMRIYVQWRHAGRERLPSQCTGMPTR